MSRRWTIADVEQANARVHGRNTAPAVAHARHTQPRYGAQRQAWSTFVQTADGYILRYVDWLPRINGHVVLRWERSHLSREVRRLVGELPQARRVRKFTQVTVTRILGPGQKIMDVDSLANLVAGLLDGLQPSYLTNDSEDWAAMTYHNDRERRQEGPMIEVILRYGQTKA